MKDIAEACGVSQAVVSLVLSGRDKQIGIAAKTREQILAATKRMGYFRNEMAVSIAKRRSHVLSLVIANMGSVEYTGRIQNGVFAEASERNYTVNIYHLTGDNAGDILNKLIGWRTSGVIFHVADAGAVSGIVPGLKQQGIPYGFVNLLEPDSIGVTTDDYDGMLKGVRHLVRQGKKRIMCISHSGSQAVVPNYLRLREQGYADGMKKYLPGQNLILRMTPNQSIETRIGKIYDAVREEHPDGVICIGDDFAMEAETAVLRHQLRIPDDIAVVGFGNLAMGQYAPVPLTSVHQDFEMMGRKTAELILNIAENIPQEQTSILLPVKLVIRKSA